MSAKRVCELTCREMHELAITLDKSGFDAPLVNKVINSRNGRLAKAMLVALQKAMKEDDSFELFNTFELTVPNGYCHETIMDTFREVHNPDVYYFEPRINDKNFSRVSTKLSSGQKFIVEVFQVRKGLSVSTEDCTVHVKNRHGVLVGVQGLALVCTNARKHVPVGWSISPDIGEACMRDEYNYHQLPWMNMTNKGKIKFDLADYTTSWGNGKMGNGCVYCFVPYEIYAANLEPLPELSQASNDETIASSD